MIDRKRRKQRKTTPSKLKVNVEFSTGSAAWGWRETQLRCLDRRPCQVSPGKKSSSRKRTGAARSEVSRSIGSRFRTSPQRRPVRTKSHLNDSHPGSDGMVTIRPHGIRCGLGLRPPLELWVGFRLDGPASTLAARFSYHPPPQFTAVNQTYQSLRSASYPQYTQSNVYSERRPASSGQ